MDYEAIIKALKDASTSNYHRHCMDRLVASDPEAAQPHIAEYERISEECTQLIAALEAKHAAHAQLIVRFDRHGHVMYRRFSDGYEEFLEHDPQGRLLHLQTSDPSDEQWKTWDDDGRPTSIRWVSGRAQFDYDYDSAGAHTMCVRDVDGTTETTRVPSPCANPSRET